jgi:nucleotide-binding universal stress UspA family protein
MATTTQAPSRLLILADDGSADADVAWLWVCNHTWPTWRAEVITATDPPVAAAARDGHARLVEWDSPHPRLLVAQSQLESVTALTIEQDRRIALGARTDADLLVIGPGRMGRTPVLGSTTDWLVHDPPSPTAVIRSASPTRRVLICTDGSAHAGSALEAFIRLPWAPSTHVDVLAVEDGRSDASGGAHEAATMLRGAGIEPVVHVTRGKPTRQILDHVDSLDSQLLVFGTRGLSGWERLRLGSTAGHLVRAASCNTLIASVDDHRSGAVGT